MTAARIAWFVAAFVVAMGALVLFPGIDLWASGLFYRPGAGFYLATWPVFTVVREALPYFVALLAAGSAALIFVPGRRRAGIFLLLALALGPGLTVNTLLKDHWGRPRPAQITEFRGNAHFVRAWEPSGQCRSNCSFPAGDPSVGFVLVAAAFLLPGKRQRCIAMAGAVGLGAALGLMRIAQGGHFLSDVVASGFLVFGISWALYRLIVAWDGIGAARAALINPSPGLKNFFWLTLGTALVLAYAAANLDRPLMIFTHDVSPLWRSVFRFITEFGIATAYLVVTAVAAGMCFVAAKSATGQERRRYLFHAWRAAYVFLAVAVSGLIADLIKPVAGDARPKLFFSEHISGFSGFGPNANYWSFPSGHSVTAAALAFALCVLYPRWRWAWILAALLIGMSRIGLDTHHLSDVVGGFYIGLVTAWALYAVFRHNGVALGEGSASPAKSAGRKTAKRRQ
ncbi:MAG: phosphatase PAP2 family protein [Stellaceae bacterium]